MRRALLGLNYTALTNRPANRKPFINSARPFFTRHFQLLERYKMEKKNDRRRKQNKEVPRPEYTVIDDVRYVKPYVHEYHTSVKGRWLNREILEVLTSEFGGHSPTYWMNAIATGRVLINGRPVSGDYVFKGSDTMVHKTHRHEPPVQGIIELVGETDELLVVNKPSSVTMHPCGAYYHNSLMHILRYEPLMEKQPNLLLVHRLDRVTSGIVILAKHSAAASKIQTEIMGNRTKKTYLARVKGRFPALLSKLKRLSDEELHWDPSIIKESEWGQGNEKADKKRPRDPESNVNDENTTEIVGGIDYSVLCSEVYEHPEVGYGYAPTGNLLLRCAVGVVSHRDGVHSNNPVDGKPAYTTFRDLGYSEADDTSVIECQPLTGRTHQIRLHLQLLGNPIANDPCYGGELFYGEIAKKEAAVLALKRIREMGKQPLGNVSHVLKLLAESGETIEEKGTTGMASSSSSGTEGWALSDDSPDIVDGEKQFTRVEGESDEQFLVRSCRYCIGGLDADIERALHCDGIWLHALQYEGEGWKFRTKFPLWADHVASCAEVEPLESGGSLKGGEAIIPPCLKSTTVECEKP